MKRTLMAVLLVLPAVALAQNSGGFYKCEHEGLVEYRATPCQGGMKSRVKVDARTLSTLIPGSNNDSEMDPNQTLEHLPQTSRDETPKGEAGRVIDTISGNFEPTFEDNQ